MPSPLNREEALFQAASQLTGAERTAFVVGACHGDAALRQRLETLLAARDAPPAAKATIKIELLPLDDEAVGKTIGRYKVLEKVGEGGCGVVYVAEQTEPVRRRVALKVIKLGMDTKQVVARFEAERQALAMMDHPNIAKVLDAGATENGRPYFVMELVRGIKITEYCDQNHLTTEERLDLFIKVCQAIQHAHQKGIIHRDIKPSNILVTLHDGVPVPKVIDFGIAKATVGQTLTDKTVYTQLQQFIGTPAYMSPEQAEMSGLDIDTRSDIYSLGVLLYELLTGRTPFSAEELAASGLDAMRKTIREKDPLRPSTRLGTLSGEELTTTAKRRSADTAKLVHQLKGDLDWIVMKCLEKDRTRRYETANGVAFDLKRHLNNEPVLARPPSAAYRLQKLVGRNKLAFAAASAVAAALLLGIIVSTVQAIRATRAKREALAAQAQAVAAKAQESKERQQADAARGQAEGLVAFMIQDLQPSLKDYGRLSLLRQVDEKTVSYYAALPPELRNAKTDLAQADAMEALSEILASSGDMKAAAAKGGEALVLYQRLAAQHPELAEPAAGALALEWTAFSNDPSHSSAELDTFQQDILRRWRELFAQHPESLAVRTGLGGALWNRALFDAERFNKPQEAVALCLELQDYTRRGMARLREDKKARGYANALAVLAVAYQATGAQDKAVEVSEEAAAFYDEALKKDPGNLSLLAAAAEAAMNLSYRVSAISQRRSRDAELIARERYRTLTTLDPANADWRYRFAKAHMMECYYLEGDGQIEAARQAFKKFDSLLQTVTIQPWDEQKPLQNSIDLARLAAMAGDNADARAQLAVAESRFQTHYDQLPDAPFDRLQARIRWLNLEAEVYNEMRDWKELERVARAALADIEDGLSRRPGHSELLLRRAVSQMFEGIAWLHQDHTPEAISALEQSVTGFRDTPPATGFTDNRDVYASMAYRNLVGALVQASDRERARSLAETGLAQWEAAQAREPDNWEGKEIGAEASVTVASLLDPTKPEEAARRQSLLNRAAAVLTGPESVGRLKVGDTALLAQIKSLRAATGTTDKTATRQP